VVLESLKTLWLIFETIRLVRENLSPQKALLGLAGGLGLPLPTHPEGKGFKDRSGAN
jgi:hypothetical protein